MDGPGAVASAACLHWATPELATAPDGQSHPLYRPLRPSAAGESKHQSTAIAICGTTAFKTNRRLSRHPAPVGAGENIQLANTIAVDRAWLRALI
jgi:hypothetical protein